MRAILTYITATILLRTSSPFQISSTNWFDLTNKELEKFLCKPEVIKNAVTYYCDNEGNVICLRGWSRSDTRKSTDAGNPCPLPVCDWNGSTCKHGSCVAPQTCACDVGWEGELCDKCIFLPGCQEGRCNVPFECNCNPGWTGTYCNQAICFNCTHGHCETPDECICATGWAGPACDTCIKLPGCVHGDCGQVPNTCTCFEGWTGALCDTPVCSDGCDKVHGFCRQPGECLCRPGWKGVNCNECVPYWNCPYQGSGACELPNQCLCPKGTPDYYHLCQNTTEGVPQPIIIVPDILPDPPVVCGTNQKIVGGQCVCKEGFTGTKCQEKLCYNNCSGHGACDTSIGACFCDSGFSGEACELRLCPGDGQCSGHGVCDTTIGRCACDLGSNYYGENCEKKRCPGAGNCNQNGHCNTTSGKCECNDTFYGDECQYKACPGDGKCSNTGVCNSHKGTCTCLPESYGDSCQFKKCPGDETCSSHGTCNATTGICECDLGFHGPECQHKGCPRDLAFCNFAGICDDATARCVCQEGYTGDHCENKLCPANCNGNGNCNLRTGKCSCDKFHTGQDCSEVKCDTIAYKKMTNETVCLVILPLKLNFQKAVEQCSAMDARLPEIIYGFDQRSVERRKPGGTSIWLGATDDQQQGVFVWSASGRLVNDGYTNWYGGQPDNLNGNEHCLEMKPDFTWNDKNCLTPQNVICEKVISKS